MPADLVAARAEQDAAKRELADAEGTLGLLDAEAAQAQAAADAAETELVAAADAVVVGAALAMLPELQTAEREVGRRRAEMVGLLGSRTPSDPPVPWELTALIYDPAHAVFTERAPSGSGGPAAWTDLRRRLLVDAGAEFRATGGADG